MTRAGRPPVGPRVSIRLPTDLLDQVDQRAEDAGVSRAEAIRVLLSSSLRDTDDGVDRTQIAHRLRMTPAERLRTMAEETRRLLSLRSRAS